MRTSLLAAAIAVLFSGVAAAQTTGTPGSNDLTINTQGSGLTSACINAINVTEGAPTLLAINATPYSPIALAYAGICIPGNLGLGAPGLTWDIDVFTTQFIVDGIGGTPPILGLAQTGSSGIWGLVITIPENADLVLPLQAAILNAAFPIGIGATQAHLMASGAVPSLCSVTVGNDLSPLSDDGSVNVVLPGAFGFYGASHTDVFVNMNGNLTFGSADSDFSPSESEFLSDQPRIAPAWEDFSPNDASQGTVRAAPSSAGAAVPFYAFEWSDVRGFGTSQCGGGVDSNSFCVRLFMNGDIDMAYGGMQLCQLGSSPVNDAIVGISPGGGISSASSVNIGSGFTIGGPNTAIFEAFSTTNPFDLSHLSTIGLQRLLFSPNALGGYTKTVVPF